MARSALLSLHFTDTAAQLYGLNTAVVPVRERWWVAPLVVVLPLALAALTALPALLLQEPRPLTVLPGLPLCLAPSYSPVSASSCCQLLLGLLLPATLTLVLVWCLALRRCCNTCQVHTPDSSNFFSATW